MTKKQKQSSFIELAAEKLGLIPNLHKERELDLVRLTGEGELTNFPPIEQWDDWTEYEATEHPKRVKRNYSIVPTTCFNCESACGLTAYEMLRSLVGSEMCIRDSGIRRQRFE